MNEENNNQQDECLDDETCEVNEVSSQEARFEVSLSQESVTVMAEADIENEYLDAFVVIALALIAGAVALILGRTYIKK